MESSSSRSSYDYRESSGEYSDSRSESSVEDEFRESTDRFYVTKESQETQPDRKCSYAGMRDLSDLDKIQEQDIKAADGTVLGIRNRVRAGMAHFENRDALEKKAKEEGRIILYLTTFRGVRSTFEDCKYVRAVLHNFRVHVEERDVYVNKFFHRELEDRLQEYEIDQLPLPQVFISGQHIGGREEIEELNETGELRRLLENFKRLDLQKNCSYCGGFEFIPCRKCGGSKNSTKNNFTNEFKSLRCTHCNENGLEACPGCSKPADLGEGNPKTWDEEEMRKWKEREEFERMEEEERRKAEKRERIKKEALQDDFKKRLKKEREAAEKQRLKEERRRRKGKGEDSSDKIARDIEMEIEKERQWRQERMKAGEL